MVKCKIPVNKTEELVIVSHKGILNIEKYKGDQRIEVRLKDILTIWDTLNFIERVPWRIDKEYRNKPIKVKIPVNNTEELVFILQHEGMLSIKKVGDSQGIEIREKDIERVASALMFIETQEHEFRK